MPGQTSRTRSDVATQQMAPLAMRASDWLTTPALFLLSTANPTVLQSSYAMTSPAGPPVRGLKRPPPISTLQRPRQRGYRSFVRTDKGRKHSKRQSATAFHFDAGFAAAARCGWSTTRSPSQRIVRQVAQMPDGRSYFCGQDHRCRLGPVIQTRHKNFAVGLGCDRARP